MSQTWIILGATSTIARAFSRRAAERGEGVILAGRDMDDLKTIAADCAARGAPLAEPVAFDARDPKSFTPIVARAREAEGTLKSIRDGEPT